MYIYMNLISFSFSRFIKECFSFLLLVSKRFRNAHVCLTES